MGYCFRRGASLATVVKIEAVKALDFNRIQRASGSSAQVISQQSLRNNKILQISISGGIWFRTRGSEVQILSPRPMFSSTYNKQYFWFFVYSTVVEIVDGQILKSQQ
jgi:hypothetical protein